MKIEEFIVLSDEEKKSFQKLDLSEQEINTLDAIQFDKLCESFIQCQNVTVLNLTECTLSGLGATRFKKLCSAVAQCKTITELHLGGNDLDKLNAECLEALFTAIGQCNHLKSLFMNGLGELSQESPVFEKFVKVIEQCSHLTLFLNDLNPIVASLIEVILEVHKFALESHGFSTVCQKVLHPLKEVTENSWRNNLIGTLLYSIKQQNSINFEGLLKLVIKKGFAVNSKIYNINGNTLLHEVYSISLKRQQIPLQGFVCVLLQAGADPNIKDESGWTPIHYAAYQGLQSHIAVYKRDSLIEIEWELKTDQNESIFALIASGKKQFPNRGHDEVKWIIEKTLEEMFEPKRQKQKFF